MIDVFVEFVLDSIPDEMPEQRNFSLAADYIISRLDAKYMPGDDFDTPFPMEQLPGENSLKGTVTIHLDGYEDIPELAALLERRVYPSLEPTESYQIQLPKVKGMEFTS